VSAGRYVYEYVTGDRTPPPPAVPLHDSRFRATHSAIEHNLVPGGPPEPWAQDLLRIARAVYLADRSSPRNQAPDRWTRHIELTVPLLEPDLWRERAGHLLPGMLEILTSDRWDVRFRGGATRHKGVQGDMLMPPATEVTLFSGGLDSVTYAAEHARVRDAGPLLLLSYYQPKLQKRQRKLRNALPAGRPIIYRPVLEQIRGDGQELESSSRSRGLLYLATGIYVASSHGVTEVTIPENGQLAVNPPLTAGRMAAASTRSVHPYFLYLLNTLIESVGGTVRVVNPMLSATKGEVCRRARDAGLPLEAITNTVSCGRIPRYRRVGHFHCGRCYPCLIRQSGLLNGLGRDDTPYEVDVWRPDLDRERREDLLALHSWLANGFGVRDLVTDLPLPPRTDPYALLATISRGREELRRLFAHHDRPVPAA